MPAASALSGHSAPRFQGEIKAFREAFILLVCRNVNLSDRRTSIRLEQEFWDALGEWSRREGLTFHELCMLIDECRGARSLTAALRVVLLDYYRAGGGRSAAGGRLRPGPAVRGRALARWRQRLAALFSEKG